MSLILSAISEEQGSYEAGSSEWSALVRVDGIDGERRRYSLCTLPSASKKFLLFELLNSSSLPAFRVTPPPLRLLPFSPAFRLSPVPLAAAWASSPPGPPSRPWPGMLSLAPAPASDSFPRRVVAACMKAQEGVEQIGTYIL